MVYRDFYIYIYRYTLTVICVPPNIGTCKKLIGVALWRPEPELRFGELPEARRRRRDALGQLGSGRGVAARELHGVDEAGAALLRRGGWDVASEGRRPHE